MSSTSSRSTNDDILLSNDDILLSNDDKCKLSCSFCNKLYVREILKSHEAKCVSSRTCPWCKIVFKNRGNLASHTIHLHQNKSIRNREEIITCVVCDKSFFSASYLRYHIRQEHYNLKTKIALRDTKRINQVWFERVHNSDIIVEMCKREHNRFSIQKYRKDAEDIEVDENYCDVDLSNVYLSKAACIKCEICHKNIAQKSYKKHIDEIHSNMKKHHCSSCNKSFNRLYFYVKHICNETRTRKSIVIDKADSLKPILV